MILYEFLNLNIQRTEPSGAEIDFGSHYPNFIKLYLIKHQSYLRYWVLFD